MRRLEKLIQRLEPLLRKIRRTLPEYRDPIEDYPIVVSSAKALIHSTILQNVDLWSRSGKDLQGVYDRLLAFYRTQGVTIQKKSKPRTWKFLPPKWREIFEEWARRPTNLPVKGKVLVAWNWDDLPLRYRIRALVHELHHEEQEDQIGRAAYAASYARETGRFFSETRCFAVECAAMVYLSGLPGGYTRGEIFARRDKIASQLPDSYRIRGPRFRPKFRREHAEAVSAYALEVLQVHIDRAIHHVDRRS